MDVPFYKNGLYFECKRCSRCCRYEPGYVFLSENDITGFAGFFACSREDFIAQYCRTVPRHGGLSLSLKEKDNYDCIFWEDGGCIAYPVRPFQCRSYPFWDSYLTSEQAWNGLVYSCPGVNTGRLYTFEDIEHWRYLRTLEVYRTLAGV